MRWHSLRPRALTTQVGEVQVARAYWHCPACGTGLAPADADWELPAGNVSWGARACASLLGTLMPFRHAAAVLAELTPMQISPRALEGFTEAVGAAYTLPVPAVPPPADLVVLELDAGQAPLRDGYHQVKVATAWGQVAGVDQAPTYATAQGPWADHTPVLGALAQRAGWHPGVPLLILQDGDRAQWRVCAALFPDACCLLDWYHLQTHLGAVRESCGLPAAWLADQQAALHARGPVETLRALIALRRRTDLTTDQQDTVRQTLHYVWANRHRMAYAEARRRGYPIGSGRIEAGVKQVLQARAKGAGMRWVADHLQPVLNARCAILNGEWALACAQTKAAARALPPGARPMTPPLRLRVARRAPVFPPDRRSLSAAPPPLPLPARQMAHVFRQAFGSLK